MNGLQDNGSLTLWFPTSCSVFVSTITWCSRLWSGFVWRWLSNSVRICLAMVARSFMCLWSGLTLYILYILLPNTLMMITGAIWDWGMSLCDNGCLTQMWSQVCKILVVWLFVHYEWSARRMMSDLVFNMNSLQDIWYLTCYPRIFASYLYIRCTWCYRIFDHMNVRCTWCYRTTLIMMCTIYLVF